MRTRMLVGALVAAALFGGARDAAAQFRLLPSVGLYVPVTDIGRVQKAGLQEVVDFGRAQSTLAFGLIGELGDGEGSALRLNLAYATASDIPVSGVGCETCSARSTLLIATAAAVIRPIPEIVALRPYLLVGVGIKRYNFDPKNFEEEGFGGVLGDQTKPTVQLGLGTDVDVLGLGLFTEVSAYLNNIDPIDESVGISDSNIQADFVWTAGIALGG